MKSLLDILTEIISDAFEKSGYDKTLGIVTVSDRKEISDFQCNGALSGAKLYKKSPLEIANDVVKNIDNKEIIKSLEILNPGFINIKINELFLVNHVNKMFESNTLGLDLIGKNKTIIVDYGGPNIAKPLHIGHLRAAIIGESLKRIANILGAKTIGDVHLGDWGLQMGLIIASLIENEKYDDITIEKLNEIYPNASQRSKTDEDFLNKARLITKELQKGNEEYLKIWNHIKEISIRDIKKIYEILDVHFDYWYGESDAEPYVLELIEILKKEKLLYESDKALVVDVAVQNDKVEIPPVIIKKTDDSSLYATSEIATILYRVKDFDPDEMWYVVDSRQALHFEQSFRCAKKAKIVRPDVNLEHLGFGTMNGPDGKPFKTRDGGTMGLMDFYQTIYDKVLDKVKNSSSVEDNHEQVAQNIAVATIKFGDLINHRIKDYVFDIDKFLLTEGKTGSFLLYTVARINSILKNTNTTEKPFINNIYSDIEKELLLKISNIPEVIKRAYIAKAPNIIAEDVYQLSTSFSKFYNDFHILKETDQEKRISWIHLCVILKKYLELELDLLGITSVESM